MFPNEQRITICKLIQLIQFKIEFIPHLVSNIVNYIQSMKPPNPHLIFGMRIFETFGDFSV